MRPLTQSPLLSFAAKLVLLLFALAAFSSLATVRLHAQTPDPATPEAEFSESQAQGIDRMIMCPVCPAETIDQAQVQIAQQMRAVVREMLAEGKDRGEILDFFVSRYGQDILAAPPKSGANLVVWVLPIVGMGAAIVAAFFILRSMTSRTPLPAATGPAQDPGLIPYLQLVDRHLDMTRGGASNQPGPAVESPGTESPNQEENS